MNWYRFKVELLAWAWKTTALVMTALVLIKSVKPPGSVFIMWPQELSFFAHYGWALPALGSALVVLFWVCYLRAFAIFRADSRYGER